MKKLVYILPVVVILLFNSCKSGNVSENKNSESDLKGHISLSGAFALYPVTVLWADEFRKENPEVVIDISAGGAGKGLADALSGMVDLGMFSRGITPQEEELGVWYVALTKDAVIPTINKNNPFLFDILKRGVTHDEMISLFINGEINTWEQLLGKTGNTRINIYTRSDACGAAAMWAQYLGAKQEDLIGTGVYGDPGLADAVKNDILAIGYNNVNYVYDIGTRNKYKEMEVIPVDFNKNGNIDSEEKIYDNLESINAAIINGIYPSPPSRDLYFVAKGKPQKREVIAFIEWILTKGQAYVGKAGYVPLTDEKITEELKKIN
jgi:phosphate transport system substrate-binding protein